MPARSMTHRIGSMIAAPCAGGIASAMSGGAAPPAAPPSPPLEMPVSTTAGTASAQNSGSLMISKVRAPRPSDRPCDGLADVGGRRLAADVARPRSFGQHALDRAHDRGGRVLVAQVLEHHRARPDLPD